MKQKKKKRFWTQHKDILSIEQIAAGSNLAIRNALRLLDDARALFKLNRYPSAAFLAIIAIEEYGKLPILDNMAAAKPEELASKWKEYRSHTSKNTRWILPALADSGPKSVEEFAGVWNPESGHQQLLDEMKQLCLYTDCLEEAKWSDPVHFTERKTAEWLIDTAGRIIADKPVNEEELVLRASFGRKLPAAGSEREKKEIIAEYFREASRQGHLSVTEAGIQSFLYGTLDLNGVSSKG